MGTGISPLQDLTKAHSILESCFTEPQLETALNYFQLVLQKWEDVLSVDSVEVFKKEFEQEFFHKKKSFQLD